MLPGIPLLENAARSGLFAAESISGYKRPWSTPIVRTIGQQPHFFARLGKYVLYTAATASSGYMLYKYISKYNNGHEVFAPASSLLGYVRSYCGL